VLAISEHTAVAQTTTAGLRPGGAATAGQRWETETILRWLTQ
jgi:hypothetical protein